MIKKTFSSKETINFGKELAQEFKDKGGIIALSGELGTGKTTFVQGFAQGLGIKEKVISPTFVLIRQHPIPKTNKTLYHIDLYRLEGEIKIQELGIKEILDNPDNIVIIEWAEKIEDQLPKNTKEIKIIKTSDQEREIYF